MKFSFPEILEAERAGRALALCLRCGAEKLPPAIAALPDDTEALVSDCLAGAAAVAAARHLANLGLRMQVTLACGAEVHCAALATMLEIAGCMNLDLAHASSPKPFGVCPNLIEATEPRAAALGRKRTFEAAKFLRARGEWDWDGYGALPGGAANPFLRAANAVEALPAAAIREIDRRAAAEYGLPGLCLMENAGVGATAVAAALLRECGGGQIVVLAGPGNNGGDAFVVARGLLERGAPVRVLLTGNEPAAGSAAGVNLGILRDGGATAEVCPGADALAEIFAGAALIVDGIFGTGLSRAPAGTAAAAIAAVNRSGRPVLALDLPSGLDADTGVALGECVSARRTVTFAVPKLGCFRAAGPKCCGELLVADIGCPEELIASARRGV